MIRLLVADDQNLIRQALEVYLREEKDLEIIISVDDGMKAIAEVEKLRPDVALIDLEMPGIDGLTTTEILTQRFPDTKVIVLSSHDNQEYIYKALQFGARGYVLKTTPAQELANVIRSIYQGYLQLGPGLHEKIFPNLTQHVSSEKNLKILEQNLIYHFEEIKQEFKQALELEYNDIWKKLTEHIDQEAKQIRNDLQLETRVSLNGIKQEVEQGLKIFQQKVVRQMEDEWSNLKKYLENQGLDSNNFQEQKMMRMQLIQLRESHQKFETKLKNLYKMFLFSGLIFGIALLISSSF
ncbi:response regulator receiver protein [Stanieria cyanosphaera PCC 7437]|uniref:Response regulator receiver protein n=1 Tax=Stanieria cyanosphaera (strain ATCC 29371 / PCC 7437) TaxID=111780 RepID=K9XU86_STAC7|nr:response regulator transcription factor [Stanieria cyanosphaera]AFZ35624.1 response regulator receiver protein [Stanieria cyanosphaera PCC 7437]